MIKMLYVAGITNLLRVGVEEGQRSSFSRRQCYSARHPHAIRLAMDWRPWDLRAAVRGETAVSAAHGGLDRLPLPWGKGADRHRRQARACRGGGYEEVPPPEPPLPPPDVPPIGGQDGGGV